MKHAAFVLALVLTASPASAQFGRILDKAKEAKKKVEPITSLRINDREERQIGEEVSNLLVQHFGVYQDQAVTKYVSLVGTVLAQASPRAGLDWQFVVLDTDGVNAYAAPGGIVHITRGALGLIKSEAELAGVLGHEIAHVTRKHTVNAIQKANLATRGIDATAARLPSGGLSPDFVKSIGGSVYSDLFENKFDRNDEMDSDRVGTALANKAGYAPAGMIAFLNKIAARNRDTKEPNGVFASHPQLKERIAAMERQIRAEKLDATATVERRYASAITFDAVPLAAITMNVEGVRGAVGDSPQKADDQKKTDGGRKLGLGSLKLTKGSQEQNTQTVASAGSRGGVPDRDAVGGPNKTRVKVTLSAADIAAFRKGIS